MVGIMFAAEKPVAPSPPGVAEIKLPDDSKRPPFPTQDSGIFGSTHSTVLRLDLDCDDDRVSLCDSEQGRQVRSLMEEIFLDSALFSQQGVNLNHLPRFELSEIQSPKFLGKGEFGLVHEVEHIALQDTSAHGSVTSESLLQGHILGTTDAFEHYDSARLTRSFVARHVTRPRCGGARYAIKTLNEEPPHGDVSRVTHVLQALVDLSNEAHFLSEIRHPNIIKIRGMSDGISPAVGSGAFILLDRIYDTLTERIHGEWAKQRKKNRNLVARVRGRTEEREGQLHLEKLYAMHELISAVEHLHSRRILHRDLKPDNVGFDVRGDVKIFDFGLAREMKPSDMVPNQDGSTSVFRLTGRCGSFPYMAPEVFASQPYNEAADVYALAFLAWQIMSLRQTPFRKEVRARLDVATLVYGPTARRPRLDSKKWSSRIKQVIREGWSPKLRERPTASYMNETIKMEIQQRGGRRDSSLDRTARSMIQIDD